MDLLCPRCQTPLTEEARFCLVCGAPQLTVDAGSAEGSGEEAALAGGYSTGQSLIAWPVAITAAAMLAVPAGLLSSVLSFSTLWVVAGGVWTIVLYRRRTAERRMGGSLSAALGSRIGCVFGVFAATVATLIDALKLLVARYGMHKGSEIDRTWHDAMQTGIERVLAGNPEAAHQIPWFFHFWQSPYGQAGLVLASSVVSAASMLGFSALGGAIGARYVGVRRG